MNIEGALEDSGPFASLTLPAQREPASVGDRPGNGYLADIRRFAMLEKLGFKRFAYDSWMRLPSCLD